MKYLDITLTFYIYLGTSWFEAIAAMKSIWDFNQAGGSMCFKYLVRVECYVFLWLWEMKIFGRYLHMHHEWGDFENHWYEVFWNERSHWPLCKISIFTVIPFMFFVWALSSFKLWNPLLWIDPQCIGCPLIILSCSCCSCPHNLLILALVIQFALLVILLSGFGHKWRRPLSSSPFLCVLVFVIPLLCPCHNCLAVSCVLVMIIFPSLVSLS